MSVTPERRCTPGGIRATIMGAVTLVACMLFSAGAQAQSPPACSTLSIAPICAKVAVYPSCFNLSQPVSVEDARLPNKVSNANTNPFALDLLTGAGMLYIGPAFMDALCSPNITTYNDAFNLVTAQGQALWNLMVERAQGLPAARILTRQPGYNLALVPQTDDRPLYWARLTMSEPLWWWTAPYIPGGLTSAQLTALELQLELASRGILNLNWAPYAGPNYVRLQMSSFDTFTLPNPGVNGTGMRNGNPSAATQLSLTYSQTALSDTACAGAGANPGCKLVVQSIVLPVNYPPFELGMYENAMGPGYLPGPAQVNVSISMSQGSGDQFNLEMWNGRFHGPSAGNDNVVLCPTTTNGVPNTRVPQADDCDVFPPPQWVGYTVTDTSQWYRDYPPQFTTSSLPIAAMIYAQTGNGIAAPIGDTFPGNAPNIPLNPQGAPYPDPTAPFGLVWHVPVTVFQNCDPLLGEPMTTAGTRTVNYNSLSTLNSFVFPPTVPPTPPLPTDCAQSGGGGNYLSNESAYRNTVLRDTIAPNVLAGHIHTPVMTHFATADTTTCATTAPGCPITDTNFEQYRTAIVAHARNVVYAVVNNISAVKNNTYPPLLCGGTINNPPTQGINCAPNNIPIPLSTLTGPSPAPPSFP